MNRVKRHKIITKVTEKSECDENVTKMSMGTINLGFNGKLLHVISTFRSVFGLGLGLGLW